MRVALILGGAPSVYEDFDAALDLGEFDGVIGANHIGIAWPGVFDAWCSVHSDDLRAWAGARERRGLPPHKAIVRGDATSNRLPGQSETASSGIFALKVALVDLGFDRAVLCGVPLTPTGHFLREGDPWSEAHHYHEGFRQAVPFLRDRARSMSGHTARVLGKPTAEWIEGG